MARHPVHTDEAPQAIGTYSQAMRAGSTVYLSGQIGLDPKTMQFAEGIDAQIHQVFRNLEPWQLPPRSAWTTQQR